MSSTVGLSVCIGFDDTVGFGGVGVNFGGLMWVVPVRLCGCLLLEGCYWIRWCLLIDVYTFFGYFDMFLSLKTHST